MIHQVKPPEAEFKRLKQVVELQIQLLEIATKESSIDKAIIKRYLDGKYGSRIDDVANWITRKGKWIGYLNQFAGHEKKKEKKVLFEQIRSDIELLYLPKQDTLKVTIRKEKSKSQEDESGTAIGENPVKWQQGVRDFCLEFFEIWGNDTKHPGFPNYLFSDNLCDKPSFNRWDYLDGFKQVNRGLYLCAICDVSIYRTRAEQKAFASIEHFFPKSHYPHLAIHPYNLVPICPFCNSEAGSTDLIKLCNTQLGISEILLPYSQHQVGFSQQAYVEITPRPASTTDDRAEVHPLQIKFRPAQGHDATRSLEIFNETYAIEKRWNNDLDQIGEHVFRRIKHFLIGEVQMGNKLSDCDYLIEKLKWLMAITERDNLGKDPYGFAMVWMLNHFVDQLEAEKEQALIYRELNAWAEHQGEAWRELSEYADILRTRTSADTKLA